MTEGLRGRFGELLRQQDFPGIESLWLELLDSESTSGALLDIADTLVKVQRKEQAVTLLSVLVAHQKEHQQWPYALATFRRLVELTPTERYLRREIVNCYRQIHGDHARLEIYVSKSGLADDRPVEDALHRLENCLAFDPGRSVYDAELGVGTVTELDLMVDKITIDFGKDKPVTFHVAAAFKHLVPIGPEHFLLRKRQELPALQAQTREDPAGLLRMVLKSFPQALKPREIKEYLSDVVPETEWDGFWNRALKGVADDPQVRILTKPERSYQWCGEPEKPSPGRAAPEAKPETQAAAEPESGPAAPVVEEPPAPGVKKPKRTRARPKPKLEPVQPAVEPVTTLAESTVPQEVPTQPEVETQTQPEPETSPVEAPKPEPVGPRTLDEFRAELTADAPADVWKAVLTSARAALTADWPALFRQALLDSSEKRVWALILKELTSEKAVLQQLQQEVTTYYKKYPAQFLYLQRSADKFGLAADLRAVFTRLLDLLDSDKHKPFWPEIRSWLAEGNDALLVGVLAQLSREEAAQVWTRIERMRFFEDYRRDEIRKLVNARYPDIARSEPEVEEVIHNTREGIERKQLELRQLLEVEIPKTSEDIGRAREFGDLSENYEFKAAKEKQARLLARVAQVQRDLTQARPIALDRVDTSQVSIGSRVKVEELPSGDVQEFTILGPWDIDPDQGIISYQAPFAQRLLGRKVGDFVPANPNMPGTRGHKVLEISRLD
jgi:transcription elongation GreA/GreB family factor